MDQRGSCANCSSTDHHVSACPTYKQGMKAIDFSLEDEDASSVKASKACLLSEAEARRKEKPQELATKKMQALTEEMREPEPVTTADDFKIDYRAAARDSSTRVQQELVTKEIEQKVKQII